MRYEELTIEGRNAVMEAFRSGKTIDKLFVLDGCQDGPVKSIVREAKKYDTIINFVAKERLDQLSDTGHHQGVIAFAAASICFMLVYVCHQPIYNIIFLILAIFSSNCAASIMWSRYCPSLRDTGMVSSATGYLDFVSYMAASISSTVFANAVSTVGWGNLILIWFALMVIGIFVAFPFKQRR